MSETVLNEELTPELLNHLLHFAIELVNISVANKCTQYKNPFTKYALTMFSCGYTAPTIACIIVFLKRYNINNHNELIEFCKNKSFECGKEITPYDITNFFNDFTGEIWESHKSLNLSNIEYLTQSHSDFVDFNCALQNGCNIISFSLVSQHYAIFHNSFIYVFSSINKCFIVDSWHSFAEPTDLTLSYQINDPWTFDGHSYSRPIIIREFELHQVQYILNIFNSSRNVKTKNDILKKYFLSPNWKNFSFDISDAIVVTLKQDYLFSRIYNIFDEVCILGRPNRWGGKNKKRKIKKSRKIKKLRKSRKSKKP